MSETCTATVEKKAGSGRKGRPQISEKGACSVLSLSVTPEIAEALAAEAERSGRGKSDIARQAIKDYVAALERKRT